MGDELVVNLSFADNFKGTAFFNFAY